MRNILLFLSFLSMAATCQKQDVNQSEENPCDPDIICTMEFRIINLTIMNADSQMVALDSFYTAFEGSKVRIEPDTYESREGVYPVITDGQMNKLSFKGEKVNFVGFRNGKKVVEHQMTVGKNCCHVLLMEGKETVVISQ